MSDPKVLREAILNADLKSVSFGDEPSLANLYIPPSHIKALKLETSVVIGGRGVGKSFWTRALNSQDLRSLVGQSLPELKGLKVHIGFSEKADTNYPSSDIFQQLLNESNIEAYDVWRAVMVRWVAVILNKQKAVPSITWLETVTWLQQQPERVQELMLQVRNGKALLVFDALDRSSNDWQTMDSIVRGLLRAILWLKTFTGLYSKVFLREDQAERTVFDFPDASKLKATQAELTWAKYDLHGLLWQRIINAPAEHGDRMRTLLKELKASSHEENSVWLLHDSMKRESEQQRKAFECLAGPWMGKDRRRGVPYIWTVSHLADSRGLASPRSFLAAIEQAAEDSKERYLDHEYALHYESIKRGIQEASKIRVDEVAEDYPWVTPVLSALENLNVPIDFDEIKDAWRTRFKSGVSEIDTQSMLPAQHQNQDWDGIKEDLQRLGILETKKDGRIDMPDLYRVGFRLGRRGGVRPVR